MQEEGYYLKESIHGLQDIDLKNSFRNYGIHVLYVACVSIYHAYLNIEEQLHTHFVSVETLLLEMSELAPARLCALCLIFQSEDSVFHQCSLDAYHTNKVGS
ncbi:conserved oligomeric Golgi complex subunit [Trifolium repens]|nr:conserved oligomeric Golgi complex subunit [Trifolium repens]